MIKYTNNYLEKYYNDCLSGVHVVGQEMLQGLENLMQDLESDDYIYDCTKPDRMIDFMENCLLLTKEPFYGKPMILLDFQKAWLSALYGFKIQDETGELIDRFVKTLLLIGRKNAKSSTVSGLMNTEFLIGEPGQDLVCSSNDDRQAGIIFEDIDTVRRMIDPFNQDTWRNQKGLRCLINNNKIFKMSEKTVNKEGLNVSLFTQDEAFELDDGEIVKALEQSMSLKKSPKAIIITTEGFKNGKYLDKEIAYARQVLNKEIDTVSSRRYLPWLYTCDSESDVWDGNRQNRRWEKANPTLENNMIKRYDYMERQVDLARTDKVNRVFVLAKDFNIKQSNATAWLKLDDYNYDANINLKDYQGYYAVGAVDLAESTDLSCAGVMIIDPDNLTSRIVHTHYFIPSSKLKQGKNDYNAGAKYEEWESQGLLTVYEGNYIDTSIIADYLYSLYTDYGLKIYQCGYDMKFANEWTHRMESYGFNIEVIYQRPEILSQAILMLEQDLKSRYVKGLNVIDKWCIGNCSLNVNSKSQAILEKIKGQSNRRIDGADVLTMLFEMYRRHGSDLRQ